MKDTRADRIDTVRGGYRDSRVIQGNTHSKKSRATGLNELKGRRDSRQCRDSKGCKDCRIVEDGEGDAGHQVKHGSGFSAELLFAEIPLNSGEMNFFICKINCLFEIFRVLRNYIFAKRNEMKLREMVQFNENGERNKQTTEKTTFFSNEELFTFNFCFAMIPNHFLFFKMIKKRISPVF
jgi:hypothetical protein